MDKRTTVLGAQERAVQFTWHDINTDTLRGHMGEREHESFLREHLASVNGMTIDKWASDYPPRFAGIFMQLGDIFIGDVTSTILQLSHAPGHYTDHFLFGINEGPDCREATQLGRTVSVAKNSAMLFANFERGVATGTSANMRQRGVWIPRSLLADRVAFPEDRIVDTFDAGLPTVRHLRRFLDLAINKDIADAGDRLRAHIVSALIDLVAMAIDHSGQTRRPENGNLRSTRTTLALAEISAGYMDPRFNVQALSHRLSLSPRYLQDLLYDTGHTFTERVTELRLLHAHRMLSDEEHATTRITEIALAVGFNDVSHFNHCFRKRFHATPSEVRSAQPSAGAQTISK